jgi:peptidoglycan/xylan/chitin deacetylase (PgdA/CDA1 family)
MTFDDGPHPEHTERLLRMADDRRIKLTFFVVGECAQRRPSVLRACVRRGHEIGNHSWTHPNLARLPDSLVRIELQRTADLVLDVTGFSTRIVRPPYGELLLPQRQWIEATFGRVVYWNVDSQDWQRPRADIIATRLIDAMRPGSIALAHDTVSQTIEAMPRVFDYFLARGFRFCTVSELQSKLSKPI